MKINIKYSLEKIFLMKKIILIPISVMFLVSISLAQDIHFSQFYASPLTLNPATTGNYTGNWRIMNNYRRQWDAISIPFETISIGYDRQFYINNKKISAGLILINDVSGDAKLGVNKIFLSAAYHKVFIHHSIHIGFQGGYVIKSFNINKSTFPDQFNNTTGYFDPAISNNETNAGEQLSYLDLNAGFIWSLKIKRFEPQIGAALFHFNKPKETYYSDDNKLPLRQVFHAGGKVYLSKKFFIFPNLLYMSHAQASDILIGTNIGSDFSKNRSKIKSVFAGAYFREGIKFDEMDAVVCVIGINFNNLDVGVSYDINVSSLQEISHYRGGLEISIIYTAISTVIQKISIPCERY